jgi:hypothetical protein
MTIQIKNIFHATDGIAGTEDFLTLLESSQVKIQRIVSRSSTGSVRPGPKRSG